MTSPLRWPGRADGRGLGAGWEAGPGPALSGLPGSAPQGPWGRLGRAFGVPGT